MSEERVDVTFLMPCLNESETLPKCIADAKEATQILQRKGFSCEILVSDNGSSDGSRKIARESGCRVVECRSRGYGNALIYGAMEAKGKYIVMADSDASYDLRESVPMVHRLSQGYDLCLGSRFKGNILPGAMPWKNRYIGNPALSGILNLFFRSGMSDAHCGIRAFTKDAFQKMRLSSPGMEFASEMVVKASLLRMKCTEVPVTLRPDGRNRPPHLRPWQDGWRHLKFLFMYSPLWLFFLPALFMMLFSSSIFMVLLSTEADQVFSFWGLWIGDHWMILAGGMFTIGFQLFIFGLVAIAYHAQQEFLSLSSWSKWIYRAMTIENAFLLGGVMVLLGLTVLGSVFWSWMEASFGALAQIRAMVIGTTSIMIGLQTFFASFLLALMGNEVT